MFENDPFFKDFGSSSPEFHDFGKNVNRGVGCIFAGVFCWMIFVALVIIAVIAGLAIHFL